MRHRPCGLPTLIEDQGYLEGERPAAEQTDFEEQIPRHPMIDDLLSGSVRVSNSERPIGIPGHEPEVPARVSRGRTSLHPQETEPVERGTEALDVERLRGDRRRRSERQDESDDGRKTRHAT